jgi:hypothetical protein
VDRDGLVIGALVGIPKDRKAWEAVTADAYNALQAARERLRHTLTDKDTDTRCGPFPIIAHGISFASGQIVVDS